MSIAAGDCDIAAFNPFITLRNIDGSASNSCQAVGMKAIIAGRNFQFSIRDGDIAVAVQRIICRVKVEAATVNRNVASGFKAFCAC
ncbi:hypothetical protein D3C81_2037250 [compost metagenome]